MRGIVHLKDLTRGSDGELPDLLSRLGYPIGPLQVHCAYPPPELGVLGEARESAWLEECESLQSLTPETLKDWIVPGDRWDPEVVSQPPSRLPENPGDWWCLEIPSYQESYSLAPGLSELELLYKGRRYDLRSGLELGHGPEEKRPFASFPELCLAMDGGRCRYHWVWLTPEGPCELAANAHDWPVGHAKKLYGYRNNEPVRGEISWDGQVCLSIYEVDALLSPAPFPWHEVVPGVVALIWPPVNSLHSVFYLLHPDYDEEEEEDVRDGPPALVLGPDTRQRYALALDRPVMRRWSGGYARMDSGFEEYGVFDSFHSLVRTGSGRLLGGNAQRLVIWDKGQLLAEDFRGGGRSLFGFEAGSIEWALPVYGGWNLLLLRRPEDEPVQLRLI